MLQCRGLLFGATHDRGETEASGVLTQRLGQGFATASGRWDRGQGFFTTPENQRVPATARASFGLYSDESDIAALLRGIERTQRIFG